MKCDEIIYSLRNLKLFNIGSDLRTDDEEKELFQDFMLKCNGVYFNTDQIKIVSSIHYKTLNVDFFWKCDEYDRMINEEQYFNIEDIIFNISNNNYTHFSTIMNNNLEGILWISELEEQK